MSDVIEAEAVEDLTPNPDAAALVATPTPPVAVTPAATAEDLSTRLDVIREAAEKAMIRDVDYGNVPGTNKPTLLKPGAEKLSVLFQLDIQLENEKHFDGQHLTVTSKATAFHAPTGTRVGYGEGMCSSREKKYAKRQAKPVCPDCGEMTVFRSKQEPGWFCWRKKGGCGANFGPDDQRITGQDIGEVENPDLPDTWNMVLKMAEKRARVDAVLAVTGASALFTQDVEDQPLEDRRPPVERPYDLDRLAAAAKPHGLKRTDEQAIGNWVHPGGTLDHERLVVAVTKLEAGDVAGLGEIVSREAA